MQNEIKSRFHAFVSGRVQGVGFRYFVLEHAQALDLTGWVRNLWDGRVEVLAEGERSQLDMLIKRLHRGPSSSHVTSVDLEWLDYSGDLKGFHARQSA